MFLPNATVLSDHASKSMGFVSASQRDTSGLTGASLPLPGHRRHRRYNRVGDLVLDHEDVFDIPIEHIGPLHHVVVSATETSGDAQSVTNALDSPFEH